MRWITIGAVLVLIGSGAAVAQPPPPGYAPIPPPRYEPVPAAPGPRVIWEPGHWQWDGVRYVWVGGRYVERRPHYHRYLPGQWVMGRHNRWVWVPAHWQ